MAPLWQDGRIFLQFFCFSLQKPLVFLYSGILLRFQPEARDLRLGNGFYRLSGE